MTQDQLLEKLLARAKGLPTELSRREVAGIIRLLPGLPPPSAHWTTLLNSKLILMITLPALVLSAFWLAPMTSSTTSAPETEPLGQLEHAAFPLTDPSSFLPFPAERLSAVDSVPAPAAAERARSVTGARVAAEPRPEPAQAVSIASSPEPAQVVGTATTVSVGAATEPAVAETVEPAKAVASWAVPLAEVVHAGSAGRSVVVADSLTPAEALADLATVGPAMPELDLRRLKRMLPRELARDQLLPNRRLPLIINFQEDVLRLNGAVLPPDAAAKYRQYLTGYGLTPGPAREIRITPDYIMVGDFTEAGFHGQARGRVVLPEN
ncbi:MAG: hypothetical protein KDC54_15855 [Lewinella sp.]|nr:hypothetical protein [Lewinella sp.]